MVGGGEYCVTVRPSSSSAVAVAVSSVLRFLSIVSKETAPEAPIDFSSSSSTVASASANDHTLKTSDYAILRSNGTGIGVNAEKLNGKEKDNNTMIHHTPPSSNSNYYYYYCSIISSSEAEAWPKLTMTMMTTMEEEALEE